jgi:hypothetical protein
MKKLWKIIARIPALDDAPECRQYFIVRATDRPSAIATLRKARTEFFDTPAKLRGSRSGLPRLTPARQGRVFNPGGVMGHPKRQRDPNQFAKSIIDIATGERPDARTSGDVRCSVAIGDKPDMAWKGRFRRD